VKQTLLLVLFLASNLFSQIPGGTPPADAPSFVNEAIIEAPVDAVWEVWSTARGYKLLGVAQAEMDFRIGGLIRSHYSAEGMIGDEETIENRILAYEPKRMVAIRIDRPPRSFPFKEAWKKSWTVITLTDAGANRTHLRIASMGYGTDEESLAMKRFFEAGNQFTLDALRKHFETAPGN